MTVPKCEGENPATGLLVSTPKVSPTLVRPQSPTMASSIPDSFQKSCISTDISAPTSAQFFWKFGIFYVENSDIGQLVSELDNEGLSEDHLAKYKPILSKDEAGPRIRHDTSR